MTINDYSSYKQALIDLKQIIKSQDYFVGPDDIIELIDVEIEKIEDEED